MKKKEKNHEVPSEGTLKKVLANSGYTEDTADKIWKWYNPPELNGSKPKNNSKKKMKI
jgi:hypothetical protein